MNLLQSLSMDRELNVDGMLARNPNPFQYYAYRGQLVKFTFPGGWDLEWMRCVHGTPYHTDGKHYLLSCPACVPLPLEAHVEQKLQASLDASSDRYFLDWLKAALPDLSASLHDRCQTANRAEWKLEAQCLRAEQESRP